MEVCGQTSLSSPSQSSIRRRTPAGPVSLTRDPPLCHQWPNTQPTSMTAHTR